MIHRRNLCCIVVIMACGCRAQPKPDTRPAQTAEQKPSPEEKKSQGPFTSEEATAFAEAQLQIEALRQAAQVDWRQIRERTQKARPVVDTVDRRLGTRYRDEIADALEKCAPSREFDAVVDSQKQVWHAWVKEKIDAQDFRNRALKIDRQGREEINLSEMSDHIRPD